MYCCIMVENLKFDNICFDVFRYLSIQRNSYDAFLSICEVLIKHDGKYHIYLFVNDIVECHSTLNIIQILYKTQPICK